MYGVIVVPTTATISSRIAGDGSICGVTSARPTAPQSGRARIAAAMYDTNTSATPRKIRSTVR